MRETPISCPGDEFGDSVIPPEWEDVIAENLLKLERDVQAGKNGAGGNPFTSTDYPESVARTISGMQDCLLQIEEIRLMLQDASRNATDSFLRELQAPVDADGSTVFDPDLVGEAGTKDHSPDLAAGEDSIQLDKFRLIGKLGEGTYGIVYQAFDPQLNRMVAVKVPSLNTISRPDLRSRFLREGESAARLTHPNIVTVFEAVAEGPISLIVSEYIPGPNLANWLKEHPGGVPAKQAARLVAGLAKGVAHAHARNVLHRDLKPSNILLAPKQSLDAAWNVPDDLDSFVPKITDFGLAKLLEHQDATLSGVIVGTPAYMPPEQIAGKKGDVGPPADIYSLGMVLYELLSGANPFLRDSLSEVIHEVTHGILPPLPSAPADLATICLKCLRSDPGERYGSALELSEDLNRFLENRPIQARNVTWMEHFAKWCRRNPFLATTVCSVFFVLLSLSVGLSAALGKANEMEDLAELKAKLADDKAKYADEQRNEVLRRSYIDDMQIAGKAWNESNDDEALRRLERYLPNPGEKDFRTFPWWLMYRSITESSKTLTRHEGGATAVAVQPYPNFPSSTGRHALAMQNAGKFAMVWEECDQFHSEPGILAQWFNSDSGPMGVPVFLSDGITHSHRVPLIDMDSKGNSLIAWLDLNPEPNPSIHQLFGQKFDALGNRLGEAFQIEITTRGATNFEPDVAIGEDGGFVVAWSCQFSDSPRKDVHCQWFDPSGKPMGPAVRVNTFEVGTFTAPCVEMNAQGEAFVTWIGPPNAGIGWRVWGRCFSKQGIPLGNDFRVQSDLEAGALQPAIACDERGIFTIAWAGLERIFLRRFRANGEALGDDVKVTLESPLIHQAPKVSMNDAGETIVVWQAALRDKSRHAILGQRYDFSGNPMGSNFTIDESDRAILFDPVTGIDSAGNIVVNYLQQSPDSNTAELLSQGFDRSNRRVREPIEFNHHLVATAGKDNTIRLLAMPHFAPVAELKGHTIGPIQTLQFSPRGNRNWLLSAADDGYARLWDLKTLKELRSFPHAKWLPVARFIGKNAERIATGGADGIIRIWDPLTGNLEKELKGHTEEVRALCDHPESDLLFSSSEDDTVRVWNWRTGETDSRLQDGVLKTQYPSWSSALDFSPDRRKLVAGYRNGGVCIWNVGEGDDFGTVIGKFNAPEGIRGIRWRDDQRIAVGAGKTLKEFKLFGQNGRIDTWLPDPEPISLHGLKTRINDLTWVPESDELLTADESGAVSLWPKQLFMGDIEGVGPHTPLGPYFNGPWMSLNWDKKVIVSPIKPGMRRFELELKEVSPFAHHCPLPGGEGVMVTDEVNGEFFFSAYAAPTNPHDNPQLAPLWRIPVSDRRSDNGNCSPDGHLIAVCCDVVLHVIDSASGKRVLEYKHPDAVSDTQFSPDGKTLFSTCADGKLRSWGTSDWTLTQERQVSNQALNCLSLAPDGKLISIGGDDRLARVWEDLDSDPVATLSLPYSPERIAILDGGATLGVITKNQRVVFCNISDQSELLSLEHRGSWRYRFSPDGSLLTGRDESTARSIFLWKGVRDGD